MLRVYLNDKMLAPTDYNGNWVMRRLSRDENKAHKRRLSLLQKYRRKLTMRKWFDAEAKRRRDAKPLQFSFRRFILPEEVSLASDGDRESLLKIVREIKNSVSSDLVSTVMLDFSKIEKLYPSGTILLVSEIHRLLENPKFRAKLKSTYPENIVVEQFFQHVGLIQELGLENRHENLSDENVVNWLCASGTEGNLDAIADDLPKLLIEGANEALRLAVTTGMAEAVANSAEHAYIISRNDGVTRKVLKKWWAFAREKDDVFEVVICDLGAGIPRTLKKTWPEEFSKLAKKMAGKKVKDHVLIQSALKVGRTRTDKGHRGKGLKDILRAVESNSIGHIEIFSNRGLYAYDGASRRKLRRSFKDSVYGTIVQWSIPTEEFNRIHRQ